VSLTFYVDHHVPAAITQGLRLRGIDVLTAWEDGAARLDDELLLERAMQLGRVLFSQDQDFLAIVSRWWQAGRDFAGLVFGQAHLTVGQGVRDLELIAKVFDPPDMLNRVERIPYS
jgi:hypothetical protein